VYTDDMAIVSEDRHYLQDVSDNIDLYGDNMTSQSITTKQQPGYSGKEGK
jgi:hypothetical protein